MNYIYKWKQFTVKDQPFHVESIVIKNVDSFQKASAKITLYKLIQMFFSALFEGKSRKRRSY